VIKRLGPRDRELSRARMAANRQRKVQ
jgi:hypothetical protein